MPGDLHRAPSVTEDHILLALDDPAGLLEGARLYQEVARPRFGPEFIRFAGSDAWQLMLPRPDADRLEYLIQLAHRGGDVETVVDAANPLRAPGPFGDKSVLELPGYRPPVWLDHPAPDGALTRLDVECNDLEQTFEVHIWTAAGHGADEPLPLLVVHDGTDYALYSSLLALLDRETAAARVPPLHVALLRPADRDEEYSASDGYATAFCEEILPAVERAVATATPALRVGMGASLGALAMLHVHRREPGLLDALLLQSGSFFRPGLDDHEAWLAQFDRITSFVAETGAAEAAARAVPVRMTCGTVEENLPCNRALRDALERQGYDVSLVENRDAHNWTAWRDTLDPVLTGLLRDVTAP